MTDEQMIRTLDQIEAELRRLEHRCFAVRSALRTRIDPCNRRKDLGYWPDEERTDVQAGEGGR
jgi:hypothetical protein